MANLTQTAVAYPRFSSDNQHEESIIAQLRAIRDYAEKNNITIIKEYIDEARSATTDDRPNFLRMIKDITSGRIKVDYVLVHKLDRFARNRYDSAIYRRELAQSGVKLIAVAQPMGDGPESIILESIIEAMAEYYSKNLSNEVKIKMKEHARKATHLGGTPPLGFDVVQEDGIRKYIINEREAEAVRLIFRRAADGYGYSKIIDELNQRGYKTKTGKSFGKNSLYEILRNEKYIGTYIFNKVQSKNLGKRNNHARKDDEEIIKIPRAIPAIISQEEWEAVRKIMNSRKLASPRQRSEIIYILTGKAVCGECGAAYTGKSQTGGRSKIKYSLYSCSAKKQKRTCSNKDVRKEVLENYVLDKIKKIFNPLNINDFTNKIEETYKELNEEAVREIEQIKQNVSDLQVRMDRLFDLVESGNADYSTVGPRLDKLKKEKETMTSRLLSLENSTYIPLSREQIFKFLKYSTDTLNNRDNELDCKKVVDLFVDKVIIYPTSIKVIFKFPIEDALYNGGGGPRLTLSASVTKAEIFKMYG